MWLIRRGPVVLMLFAFGCAWVAAVEAQKPTTDCEPNCSTHVGNLKKELHENDYYFYAQRRLNPCDLRCIEKFLDQLSECRTVDGECTAGHQLLQLFYRVRRSELPNLIVDLREPSASPSSPVLMWHKKNTAHIRGADFLWVLVFSDREIDQLGAQIETIYERSVNPFSGLITRLGLTPETGGAEAKEDSICFEWDKLGTADQSLHYAWGRLPVGLDSVNFVTVRKISECKKSSTGGSAQEVLGLRVGQVTASVEKTTETEEASQSVGLRALTAHFSNSRETRTAFSVGFAATLDTEDTSLGQSGEDPAFNGYALAKLYIKRPALKAYRQKPFSLRSPRSRFSFGLVAGTNIDDPFEEIVVGLSWGHWLGKMGVFAGMNRIEARTNAETMETTESEWRPIIGLDYAF